MSGLRKMNRCNKIQVEFKETKININWCDNPAVILVLYMSSTNHECKSRSRKIVTNILSTMFVTDTKYEKCWKPCVADWNVNAPLSAERVC